MNCYDCEYFKLKCSKHLEEVPYCEKYNKEIPRNHFAYNFFCWDSSLKYKEVKDEPSSSNNFNGKKPQTLLDSYGIEYDVKYNIFNSNSKSASSSKSRRNRKKRDRNKKVCIQDITKEW